MVILIHSRLTCADSMNVEKSSHFGNRGFAWYAQSYLRVLSVRTSCFNTDFVSQIKLTKLPLIHCFVKMSKQSVHFSIYIYRFFYWTYLFLTLAGWLLNILQKKNTRIIAAVFVKWPHWFSSRDEKSAHEVKLSQKQIQPLTGAIPYGCPLPITLTPGRSSSGVTFIARVCDICTDFVLRVWNSNYHIVDILRLWAESWEKGKLFHHIN